MTKSKSTTRTVRTLRTEELATIVGGADLESAGEDLKTAFASKEWNDDWLQPKLTSGIGGMIGIVGGAGGAGSLA